MLRWLGPTQPTLALRTLTIWKTPWLTTWPCRTNLSAFVRTRSTRSLAEITMDKYILKHPSPPVTWPWVPAKQAPTGKTLGKSLQTQLSMQEITPVRISSVCSVKLTTLLTSETLALWNHTAPTEAVRQPILSILPLTIPSRAAKINAATLTSTTHLLTKGSWLNREQWSTDKRASLTRRG